MTYPELTVRGFRFMTLQLSVVPLCCELATRIPSDPAMHRMQYIFHIEKTAPFGAVL